MRNRKHARGLSLLLCAVLLAGQLGTTIYAEGTASDTEGLCEHHPEHTAECGYVEAVEGHRCEHVHTDGCYTDQLICGYEEENMESASDGDAAHEHTQECYELDCPHERGEHNEDCGYKKAVEGRSCGFICDECRKEPETDSGNIPPAPELPEPEQEETEDAAVFTITAFDVLNEGVQAKIVPVGTKLADLNLPATLKASGYTVDESVEEYVTIQDVAWEPDNAWDETTDGSYVFRPVLPAGYTWAEDVELPEISVRIGMVNYAMLSSADDYDTGDKTAFQAILNAHPTLKNISGVDESKPESWETAGLVTWNNSIPKRITELTLTGLGLTGKLEVGSLTDLAYLDCSYNQLTEVGSLTGLTYLNCSDNQLTGTLEVSGLASLRFLNCSNNQLEALKVTGLTSLGILYCSNNQLKSLKMTGLTSLSLLNCSLNQLDSLNVTGLTNLSELNCSSNQLDSLNVAGLTGLNQLYCFSNQLVSLDVTGLSSLSILECGDNRLESLDVPALTSLTGLYCYSNQLSTLDLAGLMTLTDLQCGNTPLTSFTTPDGKMLTIQSTSGGNIIFGEPNRMYSIGYDLATKQVTLTGVPDNGKQLDRWTHDSADAGSSNPLVFPLSGDCTVTAAFRDRGSDENGDGSGSSSSYSDVAITTPQSPQPDTPTLSVIEIPVTVENGTAAGTASDSSTSEAITRILNVARQKGRIKYGIAVQYDVTAAEAYDGFSIVISRATLDRLMNPDNMVKYLIINTSIVDLTFDLMALREIAEQSTGDITLTATRVKKLAGDMRTAVGARPAYQLTVSYTGQDGRAATVRDFGRGRVTVGLAYTPAAGEQDGSLYLVYGDDNNRATWYYQSGYDKGSSSVIGSTGHFSIYGVGYKPAPAFTDTVTHWAKADIDFAASRGMLDGTSDTTFSPDTAITRGMFVMALGRLAGIDPAAYASSERFSDVPADAGYAPYAVWAASQGIVNGTGTDAFSPDRAITREEMAVIMQRYAEKLGYILPVSREVEIFTDSNKITGSMKDAVRAMQQAGVMGSKGNRLFAPKDTVTRAEAAAILRRFVGIVINPAAVGR